MSLINRRIRCSWGLDLKRMALNTSKITINGLITIGNIGLLIGKNKEDMLKKVKQLRNSGNNGWSSLPNMDVACKFDRHYIIVSFVSNKF